MKTWFVALGCVGVVLPACRVAQPAHKAPVLPPETPTQVAEEPVAPPLQEPAVAVPVTVTPPRRPSCPEEMTLVWRAAGAYCIDRFEGSIRLLVPEQDPVFHPGNRLVGGLEARIVATSVKGRKPQGFISGTQAAVACERAGKRLCEIDEWVSACRGPNRSVYPYGDRRRANVCNDRFRTLDNHPVVRLFKKHASPDEAPEQMWHPRWMNDPRLHDMTHSVLPTGALAQCTNDYGVYDMVGNLHEWVADPDGVFFGGYLMDTYQNGEGCDYRTIFHPVGYHDYSTGFRCCSDATWSE